LVGGNHDESELAFRLNRWPLQRAPSLAPPAAGLHYRLEWQGLTIIGMNTSVRAQRGTTISDAARGWLKGELEAASEPILFLIHHPIVAYGCGWMDRTMGITNGVALHQLLATHGEKILGVFHGHVHHGRASMVNGVRYFSVPSTIFQFATGALAPDSQIQAAPPGYMIVETDRASLSVEFCALAE
jgi:3',5'-cyclic AMP phosphodiesterase CpdA